MTSGDANLRSGRRLEAGRRSESIIYTGFVLHVSYNLSPGFKLHV
jgi:hypothetical protein